MKREEALSALAELIKLVADDTGAFESPDADDESVGWNGEGELPMTYGHVRRAKAALDSLFAVNVKPLDWKQVEDSRYTDGHRPNHWRADRYEIKKFNRDHYVIDDGHFTWLGHQFTSLEAAKNVAFLKHEERVRACIE